MPVVAESPLSPAVRFRRYPQFALAVSVLVSLVDVALSRVAPIGLLAVAPPMAAFSSRVKPTVLVTVATLLFAVVLGKPDRIWATGDHVVLVGA
jgi:hypothetical protein